MAVRSMTLRASAHPITRSLLPQSAAAPASLIPQCTASRFSTSTPRCQRSNRDRSKNRGVSSLYRSGPKEPNSMSGIPLPKPKTSFPKYEVDENHGLWGFFPKPFQLVAKPEDTEKHGRAWTVEELRKKSWEDLHALWWVCVKERNMLSTSKRAFQTSKIGFGESELEERDDEVRKTMQAIKHCLTERYYVWSDAVEAAQSDPEVDLKAKDGQYYKPSAFEDDAELESSWSTNPDELDLAERRTLGAVEGEAARQQGQDRPDAPVRAT